MGAHVLKLNNGAMPLFARKQEKINVSRTAGPKPALVPASRHNCSVK